MPEQEQKQGETPTPKKKGRLGCFIIGIVALVIFIIGFLAGPIGQGIFPSVHMPSFLSVQKPIPELPAGVVFHIFHFDVTNTIIATWLTMAVLILFSVLVTRNLREVPRRWQTVFEFIVGSLLNFCNNIAGQKNGRKFFPIVATIFLFVVLNGWLGLLPIYGSIGAINITRTGLEGLITDVKALNLEKTAQEELISPLDRAITSLDERKTEETVTQWEAFIDMAAEESGKSLTAAQSDTLVEDAKKMETHLLRAANTDINTPLAIALTSFVFVLLFGMKSQGLGFWKQYFNFGKSLNGLLLLFKGKVGSGIGGFFLGIIDIFIGIVELLSLLVRNISFTLRLFGNMTAGEILLVMVTFLVPYFVALPFYGLELIVGFVQALIFSSLTLIFLSMAVASHEHAEHEHAVVTHH